MRQELNMIGGSAEIKASETDVIGLPVELSYIGPTCVYQEHLGFQAFFLQSLQ
jgi:hypothetical protein